MDRWPHRSAFGSAGAAGAAAGALARAARGAVRDVGRAAAWAGTPDSPAAASRLVGPLARSRAYLASRMALCASSLLIVGSPLGPYGVARSLPGRRAGPPARFVLTNRPVPTRRSSRSSGSSRRSRRCRTRRALLEQRQDPRAEDQRHEEAGRRAEGGDREQHPRRRLARTRLLAELDGGVHEHAPRHQRGRHAQREQQDPSPRQPRVIGADSGCPFTHVLAHGPHCGPRRNSSNAGWAMAVVGRKRSCQAV